MFRGSPHLENQPPGKSMFSSWGGSSRPRDPPGPRYQFCGGQPTWKISHLENQTTLMGAPGPGPAQTPKRDCHPVTHLRTPNDWDIYHTVPYPGLAFLGGWPSWGAPAPQTPRTWRLRRQ